LQLRNRSTEKGFTLIELLVVAPVAIIAIATLISLMVGLVGDVVVSKERSATTYSVQDALDRIEQDARVATLFMKSYSLVTAPQGRDGNTAAFNTSNGDIIFTQYATTASPYDATRSIVYYADQPNPCGASSSLNRALTVRIVYFLKDDGNGGKTLWRRTMVPDWTTISNTTYKVCDVPWQRDTCPPPVTSVTATCKTNDEMMVENVSAFTTTYYTDTGATTTDPTVATSLKVSLSTSKNVAGETLTNTAVMRAYHTNTTTDVVPTTPNVYVYNEPINVYNNPILTTFAWDAVPSAGVYGVRYKINGGGWVNMPDQTGTQFVLNSARPLDAVTIEVTAENDMGVSSPKTFTYTKPLWTRANLENAWDCYSPSEATYPCPAYTLTDAGMVIFRGLSAGGTTSNNLWTMPPGLRPHQQQIFPVSADDDIARVDVRMDGVVDFVSGTANIYLSYDNIRYLAEGTPGVTWNAATITTANGWSNYPSGAGVFGVPTYTKDAAGRVYLVGLLDGDGRTGILTAGNNMMAFGAGYQPPGYGIYPGVASGVPFYPIQTTSTNNIQIRGMGSASAWNSIGAIYYPSGTTVTQYALPLQSSWQNYGGSYSTAAYAKGYDNVVTVRGLVKLGSVTRYAVIGQLPVGYRPGKSYAIMVSGLSTAGGYTGQIAGRVDVNADGTIKVMNLSTDNLSNGYFSLEGINFYQEN
jgi:type II secretory pathway pseudopilin PulG